MNEKKQNLFNFIFISVLGTLLHFIYEWSGKNYTVGLISTTNESTWEHLKLLFFPMLLLTILELLIRKNCSSNFLQARTIGIISGMVFIIVVFYTFWGVSGRLIEFINILIYYLGVIFALYIENKIQNYGTRLSVYTAILILIVFTIAFFVFTYKPLPIGLFYDFK